MGETISEKKVKAQLAELQYEKVMAIKYVGISYVGGVHELYVHPSGVLFYVDFETGQFEANDSFGKKPENAEREDALKKYMTRAMFCIVVNDPENVISMKYIGKKFDFENITQGKVRALLAYDWYDNQESGREDAIDDEDMVHMLKDILSLNLLPHPCGMNYPDMFFLTPPQCQIFCNAEQGDADLITRRATLERLHPAFFQ